MIIYIHSTDIKYKIYNKKLKRGIVDWPPPTIEEAVLTLAGRQESVKQRMYKNKMFAILYIKYILYVCIALLMIK